VHRAYLLLLLVALPLAGCGDPAAAPAPPEAPACAIPLPDLGTGRLSADGAVLRDSLGRIVLLRGINAGGRSKFAPYMPFDFTDATFDQDLARYLDRAAAWGFSALRVPFVWAAVEPTQGKDDETFLARYDALLDAAWKRRMWTIVDFHQDIYSEVFCGDGFPAWTVPAPQPAPHHDCPNWFLHYGSDKDVQAAFDRFWSDATGVRTAFGALWDRMAARHADRPGVIGFEIINEPHPGTADLATWEATTLTDFFGEMAARVQKAAPDALVFFDATGIDAVGAATKQGLPAGKNLVFAPHWYDAAAVFGGTPSPANPATGFASWAAQRDAWNVPLLIGESGIHSGNDVAGEFITALYDAADAERLHLTYWEYSEAKEAWNAEDFSVIGTDGEEDTAVIDAMVRPYPRAVAGEAPAYRYDAASKAFTLKFKPAADGVTEIVVPARAYPGGYRVTASAGCVDTSHEGLLLVRTPAGVADADVEVRPR
jgi:endoglycosylceramidase